MLSTVLDPYLL
jgi:hypothetical protein